MENKQTKLFIDLSVFGDENFLPTELTNYLGIKPTFSCIKGEIIRDNLYWKDSCWRLTTPYLETFKLEDVSNFLINMLEGKEDSLTDFMLKNNLKAMFCVVICCPEELSIYVNKKFIYLAHKLNAVIDFDTYLC